jgi:hypothetical protein
VKRFTDGCTYYPSPGGIEEQVRSALVEIEPQFAQRDIDGVSGFSTSGHVRAIEATHLLRAAQVGGLADARLEINAYHLLRQLGRTPGAWIGDSLKVTAEHAGKVEELAAILGQPGRRNFDAASPAESKGFLELRCSRFVERSSSATEVASQPLEYVVPRTLSINTIACALLARRNGEVVIALDDDDLPAAQSFTGNSQLLVTPAWRLPREVATRTAAWKWTEARIAEEYGLRVNGWFELGGRYHPSPGITPERVYPFAVDVADDEQDGRSRLHWVTIRAAIANADRLYDGHLRVVLFRAAHALGLLA